MDGKPHVLWYRHRSASGRHSGMAMNLNQMGEGIQVVNLASMDSKSVPLLRPATQIHTDENARAAAHASRSVLEAELPSLKVAVLQVPVVRYGPTNRNAPLSMV